MYKKHTEEEWMLAFKLIKQRHPISAIAKITGICRIASVKLDDAVALELHKQ